jgi:hypothetical protein
MHTFMLITFFPRLWRAVCYAGCRLETGGLREKRSFKFQVSRGQRQACRAAKRQGLCPNLELPLRFRVGSGLEPQVSSLKPEVSSLPLERQGEKQEGVAGNRKTEIRILSPEFPY